MIRHPLLRKSATILLAAAFVASVAACSDLPAYVSNCSPAAQPGAASDAVTTGGAFGADPAASVPTPLFTKRVQTTTLDTGTGPLLGTDDIAYVQYTIYAGEKGTVLGTTGQAGYKKSTAYHSIVGLKSDPIGKNLTCQHVGSRVVTVLTAKQFFGAASATQAGLTATTPLVIVADIERGFRGRSPRL